jgi:hypothetical protein
MQVTSFRRRNWITGRNKERMLLDEMGFAVRVGVDGRWGKKLKAK